MLRSSYGVSSHEQRKTSHCMLNEASLSRRTNAALTCAAATSAGHPVRASEHLLLS